MYARVKVNASTLQAVPNPSRSRPSVRIPSGLANGTAGQKRRVRWWRWGESNPRPQVTGWVFYERSLRSGLASRLPQAEDLSASPASLSDGGHRAELPS